MSMSEEKLEMHIQTYMEQKVERDRAQEKMDFAKEHIAEYMRKTEQSVVRIGHDKERDIKATLSSGVTQKLDKESLADLLKVGEKEIKKDFLIKATDDRKLSFEQYKENHISEATERVSIRFAKVGGK